MTVDTTGSGAGIFVGRAAELEILKTAADAAKGGRFSTILISGEPGIGKTRLVEEACNHACTLGFEIATGHCFDTRSGLSYSPFIQAFRHFVNHSSSRTPQGRRAGKARACEAADIIARLASPKWRSTAPKPRTDGTAQQELFESVLCFLRKRSEIRPLMLVLEDLDCADEGSLSLLLHLVRMLTTARLMIIATYHPNNSPQRAELRGALAECARQRGCQRIRLSGLSEPDAAGLAEQLLGPDSVGKTGALAIDIARLTDGNPLFIRQAVDYLLETKLLHKSSRQWVASPGWETRLAAEDGIRELVDARLARLSADCRLALDQAAVLGGEFEFEVLARMLPFSASDLADLMEEAIAAGIITEAKSDEIADYAFAHGLIRQSLYERQSRPAKRALHAHAGRAIEAVHASDSEAHLPQLALHYTMAGHNGDPAKAAEFSMRAGETAYAVCAYADASHHWRTALKLVNSRDRALRAQVLERLGEASLLSAATPAEAANHLKAALKLYTDLGQQADTARVHARLVTVISLLSMNPASIDVGQAVSHSRRAEKLLAVRADPRAEGELLIGEAMAAHAQFRTEDGLAASERAMQIGQRIDDLAMWCQAANWHGHFLWASGKLGQGLGLMEQAFERAERTPDLRPRFAAAWLLSFSYLLLWDPGAAERTIQAALTHSNAGQVDFLRQVLVAQLGIANIFTGAVARAQSLLTMAPHRFLEANLRFFEGAWTQAEELLTHQVERSHVAQGNQQHWTASLWLARLMRVQGNHVRALELLTNTPLIEQSLLRVPEEIATRSELALVRLALGEIAEARSEITRCRTLMTAGEDWRALRAFVDRAEAAVLAQDNYLEKASELWIAAVKAFSLHQLPWEVAETLLTWGAGLLRHRKLDEGAAKLDAAAQIYRHLHLGPRWSSRIQELGAGAQILSAHRSDAASMPEPSRASAANQLVDIHSIVTTHDMALLATLIHDAIAHLMNAIDKAAKMRVPIERIAAATEEISKISRPVERLARALEQAGDNSSFSPGTGQRIRAGRTRGHKLNRSHDPGRPL